MFAGPGSAYRATAKSHIKQLSYDEGLQRLTAHGGRVENERGQTRPTKRKLEAHVATARQISDFVENDPLSKSKKKNRGHV